MNHVEAPSRSIWIVQSQYGNPHLGTCIGRPTCTCPAESHDLKSQAMIVQRHDFSGRRRSLNQRYPNKKRVHRQGTGTSCFKILNACARNYLTSYGFMVSTWFLFRPLLKQAHLGVEIIQLGAPVPGVQLWKDSILDIPTSLSGLSIGPYTINLFKSSIINKTKWKHNKPQWISWILKTKMWISWT